MHVPPSSTSSPGTPGWRRQTPCWASVKLSGRSTDAVAPAVTKEWLAGWQPTRWSAVLQARNDGVVGVRVRAVLCLGLLARWRDQHGDDLRPVSSEHFFSFARESKYSQNDSLRTWCPK